MSYLFFAFWVLAGYVRVHIPGIRLQYNCYTEYTVPQHHNMYTITITPTTPLPLSIFHPSWPIPSWWKNQPRPGEGGGRGVHAHPLSLFIYHHVQSWGVRFSWECRYTPPISALPLHVLSTLWCRLSLLYILFCYVMECRSRIHEHTISLRFLRITLTVFRLEVSVYNVFGLIHPIWWR